MTVARWVLIALIGWLGAGSPASAEEREIEIILDASSSMNEPAGAMSKLAAAKQAFLKVTTDIPSGTNVGLRVFGRNPVRERGGTKEDSCRDIELLVPIQPFARETLIADIPAMEAHGQTAIGRSLELAGQDFSPGPDVKKTIVLISDGHETCGTDPFGVIAALKARGIELTVHAVGFAVDPQARAQLQRLAEMTGGTYADAQSAAQLQESLTAVSEEAGLLLQPGRGAGKNVLAASAGTRIVSSTKQLFATLIDGSEGKRSDWFDAGDEVVFSFKDGTLLERFAVPVFEEGHTNPGRIELFGSLESPAAGFFPIAVVNVENTVRYDNLYHEFPIDPPVAVRYLKAIVGRSSDGDTMSFHREWKAYGTSLSAEELAKRLEQDKGRERNLLAAENGGRLIASSTDAFQYLMDGTAVNPGKAAQVKVGSEAVFGFRDGKTALIRNVAVPIFAADQDNVRGLEFWASERSPTDGFTQVGAFETTNLVFAGDPYQEHAFDPPVRAKYLKVKVLSSHGGYDWTVKFAELHAIGSLEE